MWNTSTKEAANAACSEARQHWSDHYFDFLTRGYELRPYYRPTEPRFVGSVGHERRHDDSEISNQRVAAFSEGWVDIHVSIEILIVLQYNPRFD